MKISDIITTLLPLFLLLGCQSPKATITGESIRDEAYYISLGYLLNDAIMASKAILVYGEVCHPGVYSANKCHTAREALIYAGGSTDYAASSIYVFRKGSANDLSHIKLIKQQDVDLRSGDIVFVPFSAGAKDLYRVMKLRDLPCPESPLKEMFRTVTSEWGRKDNASFPWGSRRMFEGHILEGIGPAPGMLY